MKTNHNITGMSCGKCVAKIEAHFSAHPDITDAKVTLEPPVLTLESARQIPKSELDDYLSTLGNYHITQAQAPSLPEKNATTYRPLLIVLAYLFLVIASILFASGTWDWMLAMRLFMGGFFIAFSFFKMLDLQGFADAYRGYDLIAKKSKAYALAYPFIEFSLGLAYLADLNPLWVNSITAIVMAVSLAGVLKAVLSKQAIRCACLGTVFQLPMSTVTIIEDGLMLAMSAVMFFTHLP